MRNANWVQATLRCVCHQTWPELRSQKENIKSLIHIISARSVVPVVQRTKLMLWMDFEWKAGMLWGFLCQVQTCYSGRVQLIDRTFYRCVKKNKRKSLWTKSACAILVTTMHFTPLLEKKTKKQTKHKFLFC